MVSATEAERSSRIDYGWQRQGRTACGCRPCFGSSRFSRPQGDWVANENRPTWFPQWYSLRGARAGPGTRTPKRRSMHLDAKANAAAVHPIPSGSRGDSRSSTAHDAWSKALSRSFFGYAPPMGEIHRKRSDAGQRGPWSQGFTAVAARSPRAAICPRGTRISPLYVVSTIVLNLHFP
jgi:hypothetical protein